jgi:hypothetical protein
MSGRRDGGGLVVDGMQTSLSIIFFSAARSAAAPVRTDLTRHRRVRTLLGSFPSVNSLPPRPFPASCTHAS